MMDPRQFQAVAKALADPQRFAMLERIARSDGEVACMALVQELPITQATISHHIKELANAGLITCRKEGKCGFFRVDRRTLTAYQRELRTRLATLVEETPKEGARRKSASVA